MLQDFHHLAGGMSQGSSQADDLKTSAFKRQPTNCFDLLDFVLLFCLCIFAFVCDLVVRINFRVKFYAEKKTLSRN